MTQTTELFIAIKNNDIAKCKMLLEQGVNVNEKDNFGNTPLHWAAFNGHTEICNLLIKQGATL